MTATLLIVWDYDGAIGQVNSSYPYRFSEDRLFEEVENVETILELAAAHEFPMTFACVGFGAEPGVFPYHVPDQIRRISQAGHEVASHSWRHEWFPFLLREQITRSLERSKLALETCTGKPGSVAGFVPPFSRPMSWYGRMAFSLGDRAFGPLRPGANLGGLIKLAAASGYTWCRVSYRTAWQRLRRKSGRALTKSWTASDGVACVPQHYVGFDGSATLLLDQAVHSSVPLVVGGHPSGLTRQGPESLDHLRQFVARALIHREAGNLTVGTVSGFLRNRK